MQLRGRAGPIHLHLQQEEPGWSQPSGHGQGGVSPGFLPAPSRAPGAEQLPGTKQSWEAGAAISATAARCHLSGLRTQAVAGPPALCPFPTSIHPPWPPFQPQLCMDRRKATLTSWEAPPLAGRHTTRYLGGGCRAGVQDRWTLEEVTWVRTRLVGAERGSRVGGAAAGLTEGRRADGQPGSRHRDSPCSPWWPLLGRTGVPQVGAADPRRARGKGWERF